MLPSDGVMRRVRLLPLYITWEHGRDIDVLSIEELRPSKLQCTCTCIVDSGVEKKYRLRFMDADVLENWLLRARECPLKDRHQRCACCLEWVYESGRRCPCCQHQLHEQCAAKWLKQTGQCPTCRAPWSCQECECSEADAGEAPPLPEKTTTRASRRRLQRRKIKPISPRSCI